MKDPSSSIGPPPAEPTSRRRWVTAACMMSVFMPAVEATIVATAIPSIVADLGGFRLFSWVFGVYLLMQAITTPIYGRFSDLYGRKRVFIVGAAIFLVGSIACGFAWGMIPLVIFRAIQGLGGAALQSIPMTIIGDIYSPAERPRMMGWLSMIWGIAAVIGPLLGGFIVQYSHWPLVFWINVPVGIAAIIMLSRFHDEEVVSHSHDIDYLGAVLMMLGLGAPMVALVQAQSLDASTIGALLVGGAIALAALVVQENRTKEPIIPFKLWRNRIIASANFGNVIMGTLAMSISAFLPVYVQGVMGLSPTIAGFTVAAQTLSWSFASLAASTLMLRTSYRTTGSLGALVLIAATLQLIALNAESNVIWAIAAALTMGIGMGLCNTTWVVAVQGSVDWNERGVAISSSVFMRTIGMTLGAALGGAILNMGIAHYAPESVEAITRLFEPSTRASLGAAGIARLATAIASSLHQLYLIIGLLGVVALGLTLSLPAGLSPTRAAKIKDTGTA